MPKERNLTSYLRLWQEQYSPDVEGQSGGPHLDRDTLRRLAAPAGAADARAAAVAHLAGCPDCLAQWARLCRERAGGDAASEEDNLAMSFGRSEEDVFGQGGTLQLTSRCGTYRLVVSPGEVAAETVVILHCASARVEGRTLQVRDRTGRLLLAGPVIGGELSQSLALPAEALDLSLWTVQETPAPSGG